jgi:hypothetical protein
MCNVTLPRGHSSFSVAQYAADIRWRHRHNMEGTMWFLPSQSRHSQHEQSQSRHSQHEDGTDLDLSYKWDETGQTAPHPLVELSLHPRHGAFTCPRGRRRRWRGGVLLDPLHALLQSLLELSQPLFLHEVARTSRRICAAESVRYSK